LAYQSCINLKSNRGKRGKKSSKKITKKQLKATMMLLLCDLTNKETETLFKVTKNPAPMIFVCKAWNSPQKSSK